MIDLVEEFEKKLEVASNLKDKLGEGAKVAEMDPHSYRLPRPCGLTIHTGLGCKFRCLYCYIYDMGFTAKPSPYPLTGLQLAYAISINPAVALDKKGTLMAFGSITEPFMDETLEISLEYLNAISHNLGNPIQFSTKAHLDNEVSKKISSIPDNLSALVTVVTLKLHRLLEPSAPDPELRFETIRNLSRAGVHVSLFLRPILPGLDEKEAEEIMLNALEAGARGIVLGSMRVTTGIITRLQTAGYPHMDMLMKRLTGRVKNGRQITLRMKDLKERFSRLARRLGLKVYPSACAANIEAHGLGCAACEMGPCGNLNEIPDLDLDDFKKLAPRYGLNVSGLVVEDFKVRLRVRGPRGKIAQFREFVKALTKRQIIVG